MTRDEARAKWAESGLTYYALSKERLYRLRDILAEKMKSSGCIRGSFRPGAVTLKYRNGEPWGDIRCRAFYFTGRQALTFEPGGFIGFAGWADEENVQPILAAFCAWVDEMKSVAHIAA